MRTYRSFTDIEESYLRNHPEEIDAYLSLAFEEYANDGNTQALLSSLQVLSRVKGVNAVSVNAQQNRPEDGTPEFAYINSIMHAMGYYLIPQRFDLHSHS